MEVILRHIIGKSFFFFFYSMGPFKRSGRNVVVPRIDLKQNKTHIEIVFGLY